MHKHWSVIGEAGSLFGMKVLLLTYRITGRWGFRLFLLPVMAYFYVAKKTARQASREYLNRVVATMPPEQRNGLTSFRHFWCFGEILLDKLLVWMGHIRSEDVVFEDRALFDELDARKQGGIIIVSHLGNTEVCSAIAHQLPDIKVTMLVYTQHAEKFNRMMKKAGSSSGINMMQVTDISPATAMMLAERVADGEYIVIAGDRTPVTGSGRTSTVDFLGAEATFPQGAFILAGLLHCPVYLMFCLKHENRYHLYLEKFVEQLVLPRQQRNVLLREALQNYAAVLEKYCRLAPLQWFNFFPFWNIGMESPGAPVGTSSKNNRVRN